MYPVSFVARGVRLRVIVHRGIPCNTLEAAVELDVVALWGAGLTFLELLTPGPEKHACTVVKVDAHSAEQDQEMSRSTG